MSKKNSEIITLNVTFEGETMKAYKVTVDGKKESKWVPKSVCELYPDRPNYGANAELTVVTWFAEKELL